MSSHFANPLKILEASTGIEPVYTDLQSAASPLRQLAVLEFGWIWCGATKPRSKRSTTMYGLFCPGSMAGPNGRSVLEEIADPPANGHLGQSEALNKKSKRTWSFRFPIPVVEHRVSTSKPDLWPYNATKPFCNFGPEHRHTACLK